MKYYFEIDIPETICKQIDNSSKIFDSGDYIVRLVNDSVINDMGKEVKVFCNPNLLVELQDKLSRRNMQIKDLKKSITELKSIITKEWNAGHLTIESQLAMLKINA
jgi:hypothetical protein